MSFFNKIINKGFNTWYMFLNNPLFLFKRVFLELKLLLLPTPKYLKEIQINGVKLNLDFSLSGRVKKMYVGNLQPDISEILKKCLKKGDTFIDAGANIGYFSFIAAGLVGKEGQVHSFEPVPEYFLRLDDFAKINQNYSIKTNQLALGDKKENLRIFIKGGDYIDYNTFCPEFWGLKDSASIPVPVVRLDDYIKDNNVKNIKLIKIDVEGFEFPVLKGLSNYFKECSKNNSCPIIICEIVPGFYKNSVDKLEDLFNYMANFSYYPYEILNTRKRLNINEIARKPLLDVVFKYG